MLAAMALLFSCQKKSNNGGDPEMNKDQINVSINPDEEFVLAAAEGGLFEVKLGELAVKKGSSPEIRELGQMMVDDHSKVNQELAALAQKKNIVLPTELGDEKKALYDELEKKQGRDFDKAYADLMVKDHKKDIEKFEKEANKGEDAELKNFASDKLPTLRHHLQMAKDTKEQCEAR